MDKSNEIIYYQVDIAVMCSGSTAYDLTEIHRFKYLGGYYVFDVMAKIQDIIAISVIRIRESDKHDLRSKTVYMVENIC